MNQGTPRRRESRRGQVDSSRRPHQQGQAMNHRRRVVAVARPSSNPHLEALEGRQLLTATWTLTPVDGTGTPPDPVQIVFNPAPGGGGLVVLTPTPTPGPTTPPTTPPEAGGTATLKDGVLTITGTEGNDEIYVEYHRDNGELDVVLFNSVGGSLRNKRVKFNVADVQQIRIDGGAGDDYIATGGIMPSPVYVDQNPAGGSGTLVRSAGDGGGRVVSGKTKARRGTGERVVSGKTLAKRHEGERVVSGKTRSLRDHPRIVSGKTLARRAAALAAVTRSNGSIPLPPQPGGPAVDSWDLVPAFIDGGAGNDHIEGSGANDTIDGGAGDDVIHGDGGDDALTGGAGNDTILGGTGNDNIDGGAGDDVILGNAYYFLTVVKSRDSHGYLESGTTYQVPLADDGYTDHLLGGGGADQFDDVDRADVGDLAAADSVGQLNLPSEDLF
jgi:Ca2+-binding RTX toxin-like protein